jgi:CheY-like chemotaxis protein
VADTAGRISANVLLVDDDPADVLMVQEAFEQYAVRNMLHVVADGEQALQFLRHEGRFSGAPRPGLVLLDLNLPRRNGLEVLAEMRADSRLAAIPVVILTTSSAPQDILRSYQLYASAYISKPTDYDQFTAAIGGIDSFYLRLAQLPGVPADL